MFMVCCCGSGGGCTPGTLNVMVYGCASTVLSGQTVIVKLAGVTVATGTTNGLGLASFAGLACGSYTITTGAPTGYSAGSGSATITSGATVNALIVLLPASGYSCTSDGCTPQTGPPYPVVSWPSTLYVSDGFGLVACSPISGGIRRYLGTANRTAGFAWPNPATLNSICHTPDLVTSVSVPVDFLLSCNGTMGSWTLSVVCYDVNIVVPVPNPGTCTAFSCYHTTQGPIGNPPYGSGYYPAQVTSACGGALAWSGGNGMGDSGTFTPSAGVPSFAGSVTINFGPLFTGTQHSPRQIYGTSNTFGVSQ